MAAYAAIVSLINIIHDIQHHPSPPISIDAHHLQPLTQILTYLQGYLEASKSDGGDEAAPMETRIADAAYAGEDVIESHLVDTIHFTKAHHQQTSSAQDDKQTKSIKFDQDLQRVIEEMNCIKQMAVEMDKEKVLAVHAPDVSTSAALSRPSTTMVCSDAVSMGLMEKLTGGRPDRQVIPIVGMGGIGKTTLARNIYERQFVKEHFDVCAWITISQKYSTRELLSEVLVQVTKQKRKEVSEKSEDNVGLELYQYLFGRRFLIVMDDMWSIDPWKKMQHYFPENSKGSGILVTTRLSQLGSQLNINYSHRMEFLDEVHSWDLFSKTVFGEESCPLELMKSGKKIVESCRGLPLSIVVVGGILKKMEPTNGGWESMSDNLTSIVNLENDKHCLRLLKLSYNHLPLYLKPCFLYMGVFEEDDVIEASTIIKLWVSEGILKPISDRSLETTIAKDFLKDLVDRNLIMTTNRGFGNQKRYKIHDLLRDLCMNESQKYGFYHVIGQSQVINRQCRRIVIPRKTSMKNVVQVLQARSVICENGIVPWCRNSGLLRTFHAYRFRTYKDPSYLNPFAVQHVNLRYLAVQVPRMSTFFSSLHLFWNLHTIIVCCQSQSNSTAPVEIWKMPQCRHIEFHGGRVRLPDPPSDMDENLRILKGIKNFKCCKELVKRIPNLKKLNTQYFIPPQHSFYDDCYCVSNIKYLSKLESLQISCDRVSGGAPYLHQLSFPHSLKSLVIRMNVEFEWKKILEKIGSLPHLEKLQLSIGCFGSGKWEIGEDQFLKLGNSGQ